MDFQVLTIFPEMFDLFWNHGIIKRAVSGKKISGRAVNIRDFAEKGHFVTDDRPYGGGNGMVMKPEPLARAIRAAKSNSSQSLTIMLSPQGITLNQNLALKLSSYQKLILVCGRYEGVDQRIYDDFIDLEISIGDYVLTGGELAAMVFIDSVVRLIPGVLGGEDSAEKDSFSGYRLEHAHYTRPPVFEEKPVPDILLSGNHKAIENWRLESSLKNTFLKRKDLLLNRPLNNEEIKILQNWCLEIQNIIKSQTKED